MRKLAKLTETAGDVFLLCVSGETDPGLKARLTSVKPSIDAAAALYEAAATAGSLHTLPMSVGVAGLVTKDEMTALYTDRMSKHKSPGRSIYNKLMLLPARGVCPLCGAHKVSTLDHHLPKAKFSPLAVAPSNLIPACRDCNTTKRTARPTTAGEQTFHPYFDDFGQDRWLYADVIQSAQPAVRFYVQPPPGWTQLKADRTQSHFDAFGLGATYATLAAQELVNMRYRLMTLYGHAKEQAVRSHLTEEAISREVADRNSWQTALYRALSDSTWFCTQGFPLIPI
ncbi:HNH endonuclease [Archangium lansingense]|uniref:HNH endonuclease signature motif containing protein n=1 Tax=Archangium lansingense TaxID=2995310 RepID=A0ABT4APY1_9BACT|nr:HNH endonuclease signature motif containing protein [Archangium lansinium]MCY1083760.1 HNH endonuclease signature motif containing protein [Archangium lansinium]